MHGSAECGTLATEALAADKELRTVEETSGLLASSNITALQSVGQLTTQQPENMRV